ncbi:serine/threonine-protein kinase pelle-like [Anneissia japonica]|uniref:serine/threonine-protein kinase pelle-like n=1 Tax=Anneissia japonica TaxID=1529436 RepID=UPI001425B96F|nr:serine/threonine-protein kinase pelle-like [Anneissia japonica]
MATLGNMQRNRKGIRFVRDIPPIAYQKLCRLLDVVESSEMNWKRLAAILGFHNDEIDGLTLESYRPNGSPTHMMLRTWDYMNHTILELYNSLYEMKHGRAMSIIMDYVDEKEHYKIELCRGIVPKPCEKYPQDRQSIHFLPDMDPSQLPGPPLPQMPNANPYPNHGYYDPNPHRPVEHAWNGTRYAQTGGEIPAPNGMYYSKPADAHCMYPNMDTQCNKDLMSPEFDSRFNRHVTSSDNQSTSSTPTTLKALNYLNSFRYDKIAYATENFSDKYKRGEGAFGTVYYATIDLSDFAVKKMKKSEMGYDAEKFASADQLKEIPALVRYRHQNIVPLLGYSIDGPSLCLLYEYCEHGSLEDNLQGRDGRKPLDWATRHSIVLGAAIGLNFLHSAQPQKPLIHGDIKSANILLGKDFVPKIGDFGLARHGPTGGKLYTIMKTSEAHGTLPYLPAEYRRNRKLSTKVDVYSFGVVLLEVLTGQRAFDDKREPRGHQLLTELVYYTKDHNTALEDIIEKLRDPKCANWPWDLAGDLLEIAFRCIADKFQKRPEMIKVADDLYNLNEKCRRRMALKPTEGQNGLFGAQMMQSPMNSICGSVCTIKPALTQNEVTGSTNGQVQESVNEMKTECNESLSESQKLRGKLEGLHIGMHNNSQMFTNSGNRVDTHEISMWHKYGPCESSDSSLNTSKMYSNGYSTEATPNSSVRTPSSVPTSHLYDSSMPTTGSSFDQAQSIDKNVRTQNNQNPCHRVPHQGGCSPVGMLQSGDQNFQRPQFPLAQENYKSAEVQYTNHNKPQSDLSSNPSCQNDALYQEPNCLKTPESCHSVNPFATPEIDGNLIPDPSLVASPQFLSHHFASPPPGNFYLQNVQLSMNTSQNEKINCAGADFTSKSVVLPTSSGGDEQQPDSVPDSRDA